MILNSKELQPAMYFQWTVNKTGKYQCYGHSSNSGSIVSLEIIGIKQFHLVCTFIIWCLFLLWSECSENSLGTVVILPLVSIGYLQLFSDLKQLMLDQTKQNGYQTVPFSVYIHNLMFVFTLEWVFWKESRYDCDFTTCIGYLQLTISDLKQLMLDQTKQNRYQTVPFSVYIHNLMFAFTLEWVFWKESRYGCDFYHLYRLLIANVFRPETANTWPNQTK